MKYQSEVILLVTVAAFSAPLSAQDAVVGKSLAVDLAGAGIAVAILHPGMVKTDMIGGHGQVEPEDAAKGLLARIDALTVQTSGSFLHQNGEVLPW